MKRSHCLNTFLLITLSLVAGCADNDISTLLALDKGSLDAVVRCQEKNQSKTEILGDNVVLRACLEKNAERGYYLPTGDDCRAAAIVNSDVGKVVFSGDCKNNSDMLITGITTYIDIKNIPQTSESGDASVTSIRLMGTNDNLLVPPGQNFNFTTETTMKDEVTRNVDTWAFPYCSSDDSGVCRTWGISSYRFIDPNI